MERAPFPDVTGLRLQARSRDAFAQGGAWGYASLEATVSASALGARATAVGVAWRSVIAAAWATVAYQYMAHELDVLALDAIDATGSCTPLRIGRGVCAMQDATAVLRVIEAAWHGASVPAVQGPLEFIDALHTDATAVPALAMRLLPSHVQVALVAHRGENAPVAFTLLASPTVHVAASAMLQLRQVDATLVALVHGTDPTALPLDLQAISPPPQLIGPDSATHERLDDAFRRHARAHPTVPALVCCTTLSPLHMDTWTYAQLDARADDVARLVGSYGVGYVAQDDSEQRVALCLPKCLDMYAALLGILRAGAAWCPIDPSWPPARQTALFEKSGAHLVLTTGSLLAHVRDVAPRALPVASLDDPVPKVPVPERTAARASPRQLAYQIWTSGTTGLPKAVGIEHEAAVQAMRALQQAVPTDLPDTPGALRYLQFAAYVFDLSIFDIFYAWGHKGTVCFAPLELLLTRLVDVAQALRVTHTLLTPAVAAMVPRSAVPTMRVLINGGEKLTQVVADEWSQGCRVVNIYGPAEATLSLTAREVPPDDEVKAHNIGTPFVDAQCVLMNAEGRIVVRGAIGELLVGGPQLARGYMGEPDKTAAQFVEHAGLGRLYHTGDLARYLCDGQIEYLGRNDDQVKINGVRIELLEINAAVKSASDAVRDADTVAMPSTEPDAPPSIVAFAVAPRDGAPLVRTDTEAVAIARELRCRVAELLPAHMVPLHFVILCSFPRTSSAKIDRRAVKAAYDAMDVAAWEAQVAGDASDAPDVLQHPLTAILYEYIPALRAPGASHLAFPLLGLNSVRAMALSARLVQGGWAVSAADLATHDTLARLVAHVSTQPRQDRDARAQAVIDAWVPDPQAVLPASPTDRERGASHAPGTMGSSPDRASLMVLPATPLQQGMLLETSMDPARYWLCRSWRTHTPVSHSALVAALQRLATEWDCLRMGFVPIHTSSSSPYAPLYAAVVHRHVMPIVHTYTGDALVALQPHRPSCTSGQPLWLAGCSSEQVTLMLHHALYDEPTLAMLAERLDTLLYDINAIPSSTVPWAHALPDLLPMSEAEADSVLAAWADALPKAWDYTPWPALRETRTQPTHTLQRYVRVAQTPWSALESAATQLGASVRPIAHAAWSRILCAYLGTRAILLGDVVSLRGRDTSYAHLGGPLLSTLPVPCSMDHESLSAFVEHWRRTYAPLLDRPPVPLAYVRSLVACPAEQPLFHSLLVLDLPDAPSHGTVLSLSQAHDQGVHVEHGLALEITVQGEQLQLALNALDSHVSPAYATQLLAQVDALLDVYARDWQAPLVDAPVPAPLLAASPCEPPAPPRCVNVADWVAYHAVRTPEAIAVEWRDGVPMSHLSTLTYAELHAQSDAMAGALAVYAPRSVVAVALRRSLATYVVLVGLLRAGLVYLPLDESLPDARRAQLVQDSGAVCILSDEACAWATVPIHRPDELARPTPAHRSVAPMDPAYVLYTSGSTGQPKGCVLTHANLAYAIDHFYDTFDEAQPGTLRGTRFLARSAEAFDVHLLECFLPLQSGGTIVTMPRAALLADLGVAMADAQVTHACVVPSLFYTRGRRVRPSDVPHVRLLVVGGEKLADDLVDVWGDSDVPVLNAYGPTEATIGISCTRVRADSRTSNIGRAFPGNQFMVLRTRDTLALRGEPGELAIVGTHVGLGYVHGNDPAFFTYGTQRAYATGDRARMGPNGEVEYLGRVGHDQVKVRGVRVELGEVESVLRAAGAAHVVVRLLTHAEAPEPHLVAFVAPIAQVGGDARPSDEAVTALHAFARAHLPMYMVPRVVVPLRCLPLARASGKIDYGALADVYTHYSPSPSTLDDALPDTPEAQAAARAVQRVLGVTHVGLHTDLFGLGLDSVRAVRLVQALEQVGVPVSLPHLITHPTLADCLAATQATTLEVDESVDDARRPCLPLQWAMLAQSLADPTQPLYVLHVRLTLEATETTDRWAYLLRWRDALAHYDIYRTVFELGETAMQRVLPTLPCIERRIAAPCTKAALDDLAKDMLQSLAVCPPVRLTLFDDVLCVSLHHAVYDAASLALLYAAVDGVHKPDTFGEVVRYAACTSGASAAHYVRMLEGMVHTPLPTVTGRYSEHGPSESLSYRMRLSAARLTARAQAHQCTLPALLLHEWAVLLAQYMGEDEVTLGVVLAGRTARTTHATAHGPCITTVPFRWTGGDLRNTHMQLTWAQAHPFVHLTEVARALKRSTALFDVLFSFLPATDPPHLQGVRALDASMTSDFSLALQATLVDDSLVLDVTYAPDRLGRPQVDLLVAQLEDALGQAVGEPAQEGTLRAIVHDPPVQPGTSDAFLARWAAQVRMRPQAEAIVLATSLDPYVASSLTYAELDHRSGVYARHLAACDGPVVYVHLPRTLDLYIVLLATWKTHKTYVPLDPTLPAERLQYMVDTVGRGTLVTLAPWPHVSLPVRTPSDLARACEPLHYTASLECPAYLLFTSGSTGKPKGVQVSHRALAAAIYSWEVMLPHAPTSRLLQLASPGFDVSLFEICLPLSLGFAMVTAPKELLLTDLSLAFRCLKVTMADLPAALAALVDPAHAPPLEWLMSGGDMVDERVVRVWGTPPQRLINAYGPTEGTIGNTLGFVDNHTRRSVVGSAYPTSTVMICRGDEVAYRGAVGEIVVGGPQVADGYVGAPELTAAQFPLWQGQRVYRTGDRGRMLWDGRIECLGRLARGQVKVNGQRVELDEIAHELAVEEGIADACVQYLQHPSHVSRQLVAFLSLRAAPLECNELVIRTDNEARARAATCLEGARRRLAPYMVPAHTIVLGGPLPLTPNNKVDTRRLAAWYATLELGRWQAPRATARTERERTVLRLIASVTGQRMDEIDLKASFYALGFDSLSAIRLVQALRQTGVRVTTSELLQHGTPADLARALDEAPKPAPAADAEAYAALCEAAADVLTVPGSLPCTPLQAGMLAQWAASDGALYVHTHVWDVDLAPSAVEAAWRILFTQAFFRTRFIAHEHTTMPWVQVVSDEAPMIRTHDDTAWPSAMDEARVRCTASAPLAVDLVRTEHGTRMILTLHHALYDAHTLGEILDDLDATLTHRPVRTRPTFDTVLPHLAGGDMHVSYWLETLAGYVPSWLAPPAAEHAACEATCTTKLPRAKIERVCRSLGVTAHAFATLAFACVLSECMGTSDVCFGQVLSLRSDVQNGLDVLGPVFNTVPTRVSLCEASGAAQLRALQAQIDASRPHRHAPLRAIVRAHQCTHTSAAPLFDALLDVQRIDEPPAWAHLAPVSLSNADEAQYALNVEVIQGPFVTLVARARRAVGDEAWVAQLLARMEAIMHGLLTPSAALPCGDAASLSLSVPTAAPTAAPDALVMRLRDWLAALAGVPVEEVEATTPLLALGLDSIAAIQVVARARAQHWSLEVGDLAAGTPQGVADAWWARQQGQTGVADVADVPETPSAAVPGAEAVRATLGVPLEDVLPVSAGQAMHLRLWVQSGYRLGWFAFVYEAPHRGDVARWRTAWEQVQQRHSILRTCFVCVDGQPWQAILPTTQPLHVHEALPSATDAVQRVLDARAQPASDAQPWVAADLVGQGDLAYLLLHLFHPMYDAGSLPLLINDLVSFYENREPVSLAGTTALLQRTPDRSMIAHHWAELRGQPPCLLGRTDALIGDAFTFVHQPCAVRHVQRLRAMLAPYRASLPALIASAWALVLHEQTGVACPVFWLYHAARSGPGHLAQRAIPCLNMLPMAVPQRGSLLDMAQHSTAVLAARAPLAQTSLEQLYEAIESAPVPCNTSLNILGGAVPADTPLVLQPSLTLSRLTHVSPMRPPKAWDTWPGAQYVMPQTVHIDVSVEADDTLAFALRCPAEVLCVDEAEALLRALASHLVLS